MMCMISFEQRQHVHELIVLDLAIRSLQHDYTRLTPLKLEKLYVHWLDYVLEQFQKLFQHKKQTLATDNIRLVNYQRLDDYFCEITISTSGNDATLLYANEVLKQDVEKLLFHHIHLYFKE